MWRIGGRPGRGVDADGWDWAAVRSLCLREAERVVGPGAAAEDAAQEAALRAWRKRGDCDSPAQPSGWIATIARREALRCFARRRDEDPLEDALSDAASTAEPDVLARLDVRDALLELSSDDRALLFARYWADLTQTDAGAALGVADGTIKVRLHRLRMRLRDRLAEA
jgi:RNA polymerase sigma-70 factor (ECF subfamily)